MSILVLLFLAGPWDVPTEPTWVKLAIPVVLPTDPYQEIHHWNVGQTYPDVHEQTHFVNNWFSNSWGKTTLYCLKGRIITLVEPPLTLTQIGQTIPADKRVHLWHDYLSGRSSIYGVNTSWNTRPLIILNEWVAYTNEWEWNHTEFGLANAQEISLYANALLTLAEKCPNYDAGPLRIFVRWHENRINQQDKPRTKLLCRT
jgi:hypothetical protein